MSAGGIPLFPKEQGEWTDCEAVRWIRQNGYFSSVLQQRREDSSRQSKAEVVTYSMRQGRKILFTKRLRSSTRQRREDSSFSKARQRSLLVSEAGKILFHSLGPRRRILSSQRIQRLDSYFFPVRRTVLRAGQRFSSLKQGDLDLTKHC